MNNTTGQTTVMVTTATAKPKATIQKRVIYDVHGKAHVKEFMRGIMI